MAEWTEEILNNCEKTYCVKIGFKGAINIVAFTTTYEDAERIVNEFIQDERCAVIEEYHNADMTFRIDVQSACLDSDLNCAYQINSKLKSEVLDETETH